jgi:hypothetical protein
VIAILPDQEKELGEVRADQFIITSSKASARGTILDVLVIDKCDPLAQSLGLA